MTLARMIRVYKTAAQPQLSGLREMEDRDVSEVADLFTRYMQRFSMGPVMTMDEVRHQLLSGRGRTDEPLEHYRRPGQVVWTYVVEVNFLFMRLLLFLMHATGPKNTPDYRLLFLLLPSFNNHKSPKACVIGSCLLVLLCI
jgi:hypothetical protein